MLEGTGRIRVGDETLTVPRYGGVLVGPAMMRQVFNDSPDTETLWLIIGAPDKEFPSGEIDMKQIWPVDPTQLPPEMEGVPWPRKN